MKFIQKQLKHPSGLTGRLWLPLMWNQWNFELHKVAFQALDVQSDDRVLEIGFGGGSLLKRLHPIIQNGFIAGIDHSIAVCRFCDKWFNKAIRSGRPVLIQSCAEAIPFTNEFLNKVCSVNSVFFWDDIPQAFQEIARVLKPGGRHILVFTDPESLQGRPVLKDALNPVTPSEIHEMLSKAGFEMSQTSEHRDPHRCFHCIISYRTI